MNYDRLLPEAPPMRLPRARFTVRRLMVCVAVAALVLGAIREARQRQQRRMAAFHMYERKLGPLILKGMYPVPTISAEEERLSALYLRLAGEYWYRSTRPWLPEPSPAPPEDLGTPAEEYLRFRRNQRN